MDMWSFVWLLYTLGPHGNRTSPRARQLSGVGSVSTKEMKFRYRQQVRPLSPQFLYQVQQGVRVATNIVCIVKCHVIGLYYAPWHRFPGGRSKTQVPSNESCQGSPSRATSPHKNHKTIGKEVGERSGNVRTTYRLSVRMIQFVTVLGDTAPYWIPLPHGIIHLGTQTLVLRLEQLLMLSRPGLILIFLPLDGVFLPSRFHQDELKKIPENGM